MSFRVIRRPIRESKVTPETVAEMFKQGMDTRSISVATGLSEAFLWTCGWYRQPTHSQSPNGPNAHHDEMQAGKTPEGTGTKWNPASEQAGS